MTPARILLLLLAAAAAFQAAHYFPLMPDPMASHFGPGGRPDGFQSRSGFFVLAGALLGGTLALFLALSWLLPRIPPRWVNLPHREFWLAPGRRAEALGRLAARLEWFGVATLGLLLAILQLVFEANLRPGRRMDRVLPWAYLAAYLAFVVAWLVGLYRAFRVPQNTMQGPRTPRPTG